MIVAQHEISVRRTVGRLLGYADAANDDLVQDVFMAAWRGRRRLRRAGSLASWLQSIAIRRCRSHVSRRVRRRRLARVLPLGGVDHQMIVQPAKAAAMSVDPELERALATLSHDHREVIVLHHLEGLTASQIGTALGLRAGAVDGRLHRARRALRQALECGQFRDERRAVGVPPRAGVVT